MAAKLANHSRCPRFKIALKKSLRLALFSRHIIRAFADLPLRQFSKITSHAAGFHVPEKSQFILFSQDFLLADVAVEIEHVQVQLLGRDDLLLCQLLRGPQSVESP